MTGPAYLPPAEGCGRCTHCGAQMRLKLDGTVWAHSDRTRGRRGGWRPPCPGAGQPPRDAEESQ